MKTSDHFCHFVHCDHCNITLDDEYGSPYHWSSPIDWGTVLTTAEEERSWAALYSGTGVPGDPRYPSGLICNDCQAKIDDDEDDDA